MMVSTEEAPAPGRASDNLLAQHIIVEVTKHFDTQVNWLNHNFEGHVKSVHDKIEFETRNADKATNTKMDKLFAAFHKRLKSVEELKQVVEMKTVGLSVGIFVFLYGLAAMVGAV